MPLAYATYLCHTPPYSSPYITCRSPTLYRQRRRTLSTSICLPAARHSVDRHGVPASNCATCITRRRAAWQPACLHAQLLTHAAMHARACRLPPLLLCLLVFGACHPAYSHACTFRAGILALLLLSVCCALSGTGQYSGVNVCVHKRGMWWWLW